MAGVQLSQKLEMVVGGTQARIALSALSFDVDKRNPENALRSLFLLNGRANIQQALVKTFAEGEEGTAPDQWIARAHNKKLQALEKEIAGVIDYLNTQYYHLSPDQKAALDNLKRNKQRRSTNPYHFTDPTSKFKTAYVPHAQLRFVQVRLAIVRVRRVFNSLKHGFLKSPTAILIFNILMLSNIFELLLDVALLIKHTVKHDEKVPSPWKRFKRALWKQNIYGNYRSYRLWNALITFITNLITFIVAAGAMVGLGLILLNGAMFFSDWCIDVGKNFDAYMSYARLKKVIDRAIETEEEKPASAQDTQYIEALKDLRAKAAKKANELFSEWVYVSACATLTFAGMCLVLTNPVGSVAFTVGAILALVFASVFTGLGRLCYKKTKGFLSDQYKEFNKAREPKKSPQQKPSSSFAATVVAVLGLQRKAMAPGDALRQRANQWQKSKQPVPPSKINRLFKTIRTQDKTVKTAVTVVQTPRVRVRVSAPA
ncbi:MAG TPA: hypothetical protein VNC84_04555 [Gammaproteobacteria bacterium]|jgi:hypothetical protein|nr:hypothetical protein [Gammaproteobacteria bacterium]